MVNTQEYKKNEAGPLLKKELQDEIGYLLQQKLFGTKQITQKKLGDAAGVSQATIARALNGKKIGNQTELFDKCKQIRKRLEYAEKNYDIKNSFRIMSLEVFEEVIPWYEVFRETYETIYCTPLSRLKFCEIKI